MAEQKKADEAKKVEEQNKSDAASTATQGKTALKTDEPAKNESNVSGSPVTTATPGNEDKGSPVTTASTSDKSQQPANPAPGPQSTKSLTPGAMGAKAEGGNEPPKNEASDNTPDEDGDGSVTPEEQAKLDRMFDAEDERENHSAVSWGGNPNYADSIAAAKKFQKLAAVVPKDTPDEHIMWGAGGASVTVGDLRALCKVMPTS